MQKSLNVTKRHLWHSNEMSTEQSTWRVAVRVTDNPRFCNSIIFNYAVWPGFSSETNTPIKPQSQETMIMFRSKSRITRAEENWRIGFLIEYKTWTWLVGRGGRKSCCPLMLVTQHRIKSMMPNKYTVEQVFELISLVYTKMCWTVSEQGNITNTMCMFSHWTTSQFFIASYILMSTSQ